MQRIIATIKQNETGFVVSNLQEALLAMFKHGYIIPMPAGETPTEKDLQNLAEKLKVEQAQSLYGEATTQLIFYFQLQNGLGDKLRGLMVDDKTAEKLNAFLGDLGLLDNAEFFTVYGVIKDSNGNALPKLIVRAYDRDLRKEQLLGKEAITDNFGNYKITYAKEDFAGADFGNADAENAAPDLIVKAFNVEDTLLVQSAIKFNASRIEVVDLVVTVEAPLLASEWERINSIVLPLLNGQGEDGKPLNPYELTADDIGFIVQDTSLDKTALVAWVDASVMLNNANDALGDEHKDEQANLSKLGWQYFYAMTRQELSNNLDGLLTKYSADWLRAFKNALVSNRVPYIDDKTLEHLASLLVLIKNLHQINPAKNAENPFTKVLLATNIDIPKKLALDAWAIAQEKGMTNPEAFLDLAKDYPNDKTAINSLVRGVRINQLVNGNDALFQSLSKKLDGNSDSIEPLAALPTSVWVNLADDASVSAGSTMKMQVQVEKQHPLEALKARVESNDLQLPGMSKSEIKNLIKNEGEVAESILNGKKSIKELNDVATPKSHKTLRDLGRFMRTGLSIEFAGHLMSKGITSPAAAMRAGKEALKEEHELKFPVANNSEMVDRYVIALEGYMHAGYEFVTEAGGSMLLPSYLNDGASEPLTDSVKEAIPSIAEFFGDLDDCYCRPCESMLGQPAYLVDLLNLLKNPSAGIHSFDALTALAKRRMDILELPLSCESAETEIQHIDIVVELLEKEMGGLEPAYLKTANATFPWQLPFDLAKAKINAYLEKMGVSQLDIISLRNSTTPLELAAETLEITSKQGDTQYAISEWQLITESRTNRELWKLFWLDGNVTGVKFPVIAMTEDFYNATVAKSLMQVSFLMEKTGLDLETLEKVVATKFVGELTIENREQCKPSLMFLNVTANQAQVTLDRIHRFVRLKSKLEDSTFGELDSASVLDMAITACNEPDDTTTSRENLLIKLALIKRLHDRYAIPLEYLINIANSASKIRLALKFSETQFKLLKRINGFEASDSIDWVKLEKLLISAEQMRDAGITIEQAGSALLSETDLDNANLIEKFLNTIKERLNKINKPNESKTESLQVAEYLAEIFDAPDVKKLMEAINKAGEKDTTALLSLIKLLHKGDDTTHELGDWHPLLPSGLAAEILSTTTTNNLSKEERCKRLLAGIVPRRLERELILVISDLSALPQADVAMLLQKRLLLDTPQNNSDFAFKAFLSDSFLNNAAPIAGALDEKLRLSKWVNRLYRLIALMANLKLDSEMLALANKVILGATQGINWRDLLAPILGAPTASQEAQKNWQALLDLVWLQRSDMLTRPVLAEVISRLQEPLPLTIQAYMIEPMALRLGVEDIRAIGIVGQAIAFNHKNNLLDPGQLKKAFKLLLLTRHLQADGNQITELAYLTNNSQASKTAISLVKANFDEKTWKKIEQSIKDPLRKLQRDALVAYLVQNKGMRDANELYEHYLIDPLVQPCMKTTRLLEAIMATQLFIQRVLFGLEKDVSVRSDVKDQWVWMRNYRVWEANRKVFLFPENWLFPELRDDKSSSFKQLESALGQGELNKELANEAFGQFLDDVAQMAQIQVLGMYEDTSHGRKLYVVGRTTNPPYAYYWRSCEDFGGKFMEWLPWQRIELDIQSDHVMPFVLGSSLYLAWPIIKYNHQEEPKKSEWEVKLAWSRYDGRTWRKSSISRDPAIITDIAFMDERWGLSFRANGDIRSKEVTINVYALDPIASGSKTKAVSTSGNGGGFIFPIFNSGIPLEEETFIANIIKGGRTGTGTTEDFSSNYSVLPVKDDPTQFDIKNLLEANWMTFGSWRSAPGDVSIDPNGADPAYLSTSTLSSVGQFIFSQPETAISNHIQLKIDFTHFQKAKFFNHGEGIPTGNSFEDSLLPFLIKLKPTTNYLTFKTTLATVCSLRAISCMVWLKVSLPSVGLVVLDGTKGSYDCLIEGQNLSPNTPISIYKLGKQTCPAYTLKLTLPDGTSLTGLCELLPDAPINATTNQNLHFLIDGSALNQAQLDSLNVKLNASRTLSLAYEFRLTHDNHISFFKSAQRTPISNLVQHTKPWMNGYQELPLVAGKDIANYPLTIDSQYTFDKSTDSLFWVVGASNINSAACKIWHFSEEGISRYIELKADGAISDSGLQVYPDSYREASLRRAKWSELESLEESMQDCTFQANNAPTVLDLNTPDWQKAVDGKLAYDARMPYACYNWEVFFHAPLLIADQLSKQHKFEDAERWLRYVFDPTEANPSTDAKRFLKFRLFKDPHLLSRQVIDDMKALAQAASTNRTDENIADIKKLIERWRERPFRPFVIARGRQVAFLWRTLFAYLDNLLAWADSLYRRDTRESNNEATLLYVLAHKILGNRPQQHQGPSKQKAFSYLHRIDKWDEFANTWLDIASSAGASGNMRTHLETNQNPSLEGILNFCMPFNDKILNYWNTVDERLFNLRHCRNIDGVTRDLPFTDAPIDPELLIRATAAGLDLGDVINGLYAPPSHYRYNVLSARASELANEARGLGAALLSAIEKRDAESLSLLRSSNEINLLKLVKDVRTLQIDETDRNLDALRASRHSVEARYRQYQRLLGKKDITVPNEQQTVGEESMLGTVDDGLASQRSGLGLIKEENEQYVGIDAANTWSTAANITKIAGSFFHFGAAAAAAVPKPVDTDVKLLTAIGHGISLAGDGFSFISQAWRTYAEQQGMLSGHLRRRDEWAFQSNQTLKELQQIDKQILANEIRVLLTRKELDNHIEQIEQAKAVEEVMRSKFSNVQLYDWMVTQITAIHSNAYRMALDMARRAEKCAARELGGAAFNIIKNDYWDSLKSGLLAGDRLVQDIKRLEVEYLNRNIRELEITKHISLRQLDPLALMQLRKDCSCDFNMPEVLFDLDFPGHYFRRIKSVSVSVPCVVGPYTSVNGTLTLLSSQIREKNNLSDDIVTSYLPIQSIATSTGQNDSGLFELNFRDERFLPFESGGVISKWRFSLPKEFKPFDYDTISDVILHIRYTARHGGETLADEVTRNIMTKLNTLKAYGEESEGLWQLIDLRHDFPNEWHQYKTNPNATEIKINIGMQMFPYLLRGKTITVLATEPPNVISSTNIEITSAEKQEVAISRTGISDSGLIALRYTVN